MGLECILSKFRLLCRWSGLGLIWTFDEGSIQVGSEVGLWLLTLLLLYSAWGLVLPELGCRVGWSSQAMIRGVRAGLWCRLSLRTGCMAMMCSWSVMTEVSGNSLFPLSNILITCKISYQILSTAQFRAISMIDSSENWGYAMVNMLLNRVKRI